MRFSTYRFLLLAILVLTIVGCGGGGGGGGGVDNTDTTSPTVNSFTLPATATSLTVPVSGFSASDNVGVIGYLISESATKPAASAAGWSATAPTSFTFSGEGARTAYAWAKDAAGNISASKSATVTITLPASKTATLKFNAQSTNPNESIAGFLLTVNLPPNSFLPVDSNFSPLPGTVTFAGSNPLFDNYYDAALLQLNSNYIFSEMSVSNFVNLGQFITIVVTVPVGYTPNVNDISYSFTAKNSSGTNLTTITVIPTFN